MVGVLPPFGKSTEAGVVVWQYTSIAAVPAAVPPAAILLGTPRKYDTCLPTSHPDALNEGHHSNA
jgi:hypothetical protein